MMTAESGQNNNITFDKAIGKFQPTKKQENQK